MDRKSLFSGPSLYTPRITHMLFVDWNDHFSFKEWNHHSGTDSDLSAPLHLFFTKGRITAWKEVKTIISLGMWRVSVLPMGRLSVLSTPVAGSVMSHVVFLIVFSLKPLTDQLPNKRSNSWHDIRRIWRLGPENNYFLCIETFSYFTISHFVLHFLLYQVNKGKKERNQQTNKGSCVDQF